MKRQASRDYTIHVAKKLTPPAVWEWLLVAIETPYSDREVVELLPESELAVEYHERMRNY